MDTVILVADASEASGAAAECESAVDTSLHYPRNPA